jgi:hypothetical protein
MEAVETLSPVMESIVEKLKGKSEEELKLLYIRLFADEIEKEWEEVTSGTPINSVSDEDIVEAVMKGRYGSK